MNLKTILLLAVIACVLAIASAETTQGPKGLIKAAAKGVGKVVAKALKSSAPVRAVKLAIKAAKIAKKAARAAGKSKRAVKKIKKSIKVLKKAKKSVKKALKQISAEERYPVIAKPWNDVKKKSVQKRKAKIHRLTAKRMAEIEKWKKAKKLAAYRKRTGAKKPEVTAEIYERHFPKGDIGPRGARL
jgi:hypothetical protein